MHIEKKTKKQERAYKKGKILEISSSLLFRERGCTFFGRLDLLGWVVIDGWGASTWVVSCIRGRENHHHPPNISYL
jgi:hypothetical protein